MDCQTALQILDALPPSALTDLAQTGFTTGDGPRSDSDGNTGDPADSPLAAAGELPGLPEALAHVQQHDDCAAILRQRRQLDARIAQAMHDIPVPAGLKERLLAAVADADGSNTPEESAAADVPVNRPTEDTHPALATPARSTGASSQRLSRRIWMRVTLASLAGVAVVLFGWLLRPAAVPAHSLEEIVQQAPWQQAELAALPEFDQSFKAELPLEWRYGRMAIAPARGAVLSEQTAAGAPHSLAAYAFRMPLARRPAVTGTLLVMPVSAVTNPPTSRSFHSGGYARIAAGNGAVKAWRSDSHVFVCLVHGGVDALEQLQRALEPTAV